MISAPGYALAYDPLTRFHELQGTSGRRRVYDGDKLIVEYHPTGALARRFVHGPGTDEPLVWYGSGGTVRRFLHADQRGSIVSATDVNGNPIVTYLYDEYGGWRSGNSGTFFYTGQTGYTELGLYYYKNRWRHPRLDRFMQTDPIGYGDGMNMYAYVKGDPVNSTDPLGLGDHDLVCNGGPCSDIVITGGGGGRSNGVIGRLGVGSGGKFQPRMMGDGGKSGPDKKVKCKLGNGKIDVSFDGTTLNIRSNITLIGPGADQSGAYIAGIGTAWTKNYGHINSIADISAGPGGVIAEISSGIIPPGGPRSTLGGNHMWLGNLGAMSGRQIAYATQHVAPHEFGHSLKIDNMPPVGKWKDAIMANSANDVSPTDLEAVVEACRAAQ